MSPKVPLRSNYDVEFRNLRFTVPSKKSDRPPTVILKSVSGACRGCCLTAIMGASGAGEFSRNCFYSCGSSAGTPETQCKTCSGFIVMLGCNLRLTCGSMAVQERLPW